MGLCDVVVVCVKIVVNVEGKVCLYACTIVEKWMNFGIKFINLNHNAHQQKCSSAQESNY